MVKSLKKVSISEMPEQLELQFEVKTNGEKDPKYSQKQIFETQKKGPRVVRSKEYIAKKDGELKKKLDASYKKQGM
jgi:hypothetical protein